jgi:hypothetical protein
MTNISSSFDTAVAAYRAQCDRNNLTFEQPLEEHSTVIHDVVYLRNSSTGYIARYSIKRRHMLI